MGVHAAPEVIHRCGDQARDLGGSADGLARHFEVTEETVGAVGGLAAAVALESCRGAWSARMLHEATGASALGDNLHRAADQYQATDAANADRIHVAGGSLLRD